MVAQFFRQVCGQFASRSPWGFLTDLKPHKLCLHWGLADCMRRRFSGWASPLLALVLVCLGCVVPMTPAAASVHTYPDATTQSITYRSLQSLRDTQGSSWQLVLYKRVKSGNLQRLRLRVVGFPGRRFVRPQSLAISAATGQTWQAPDVSETALRSGVLPENAAEFDMAEVMRQLDTDAAMRLQFALVEDGRAIEVPVPPVVVREWRSLVFNVGTSTL